MNPPAEPPPQFHDDFLADEHGAGPSTPLYSPEAHATERVLQTWADYGTTMPGSEPPLPYDEQPESEANHFIYNNDYMHINMGRRMWGPRQPAYGFNGLVQGSVKLTKKCSHVFRLEITLLGQAKVSATSRGMVSDTMDKPVVSSPVTLFNATAESVYCPTDHVFTFSIPFPTFIKGGTSPIPPSYMAWSPGLQCEIIYFLKIDVFRKGFRRHENKIIPVLYLPKTWPSRPPPPRDIMHSTPDDFRTLTLKPVWPSDACPRFKARATVPTVQMVFPADAVFSSGSVVPLKLIFTCADAPALAKLLISSTEIRLVKRTLAWVQGISGRGMVSGRELTLAKGQLVDADTAREGVALACFELVAGETGREQSWRIQDAIEVVYFVRVAVRGAAGTTNYVPCYHHDEPVQIATEPWGTRAREELQLGGLSAPAIGMSHTRMELRPTHSMAW